MNLPMIKTASDLDALEWKVIGHHRATILAFCVTPGKTCSIWITQRQGYCDRGHFQLQVDLPGYSIDGQDGFPRYYMSLQRAKEEAIDFLKWRLFKLRVNKEVIASTPSLLEVMLENETGE